MERVEPVFTAYAKDESYREVFLKLHPDGEYIVCDVFIFSYIANCISTTNTLIEKGRLDLVRPLLKGGVQ